MNTFLQRVATGASTFERHPGGLPLDRAGQLPINPGITNRTKTTAPGRPSAVGFNGWGTHMPAENVGEPQTGGEVCAQFSAGTFSFAKKLPVKLWNEEHFSPALQLRHL